MARGIRRQDGFLAMEAGRRVKIEVSLEAASNRTAGMGRDCVRPFPQRPLHAPHLANTGCGPVSTLPASTSGGSGSRLG